MGVFPKNRGVRGLNGKVPPPRYHKVKGVQFRLTWLKGEGLEPSLTEYQLDVDLAQGEALLTNGNQPDSLPFIYWDRVIDRKETSERQ